MLFGSGGQTTLTDEGGRFRFLHVGAGRYEVAAALRGHRTAPADVIVAAGESRENLVLSLASGARIRGTVSGLPAAQRGGVRVTASGAEGYSAATTASADGVFELTGAPAGPVDLRAFAGDGTGAMRSASAQVAVAEGQDDVSAQIVFEAGFSLSGTVTRNALPVEGALVSAALRGRGALGSARTSASGAYRLDGLSEGAYDVMVSPAGGRGAAPRAQEVTVSGDTALDLVIPAARLGGVVLDGTTRQPLPDTFVQAAVREAVRGPRSVTTDSNGRFSFEDLDASPYTPDRPQGGLSARDPRGHAGGIRGGRPRVRADAGSRHRDRGPRCDLRRAPAGGAGARHRRRRAWCSRARCRSTPRAAARSRHFRRAVTVWPCTRARTRPPS